AAAREQELVCRAGPGCQSVRPLPSCSTPAPIASRAPRGATVGFPGSCMNISAVSQRVRGLLHKSRPGGSAAGPPHAAAPFERPRQGIDAAVDLAFGDTGIAENAAALRDRAE